MSQKTDPLSEANKNPNEGDYGKWSEDASAILPPTVRDPGGKVPAGTPTWKGSTGK